MDTYEVHVRMERSATFVVVARNGPQAAELVCTGAQGVRSLQDLDPELEISEVCNVVKVEA